MMQSQTTWQETVVLPVGYLEESNGKIYREATLRKMTGNEEALLADPKLRSNAGKLITALLASCVTALEEVEKVNPALIRRLSSVVYLDPADNPRGVKPGTMPPFHTDLRERCHGLASFSLPARTDRIRVAVCHARLCLAE